jgi:hypothetical protein
MYRVWFICCLSQESEYEVGPNVVGDGAREHLLSIPEAALLEKITAIVIK